MNWSHPAPLRFLTTPSRVGHTVLRVLACCGPFAWQSNKAILLCVLRRSVVFDSYCDPMDCSPPGSSVHGVLPATILKWIAIPFTRGSSWPRDQTHISYISCISRLVLYHWHHLGSPQIGKVLCKLDWVYHISFNPDLSDSRTHAIKHKTKTCPQGDLGLIGELNMGTDSHHVYWEGLLL